MLRAPQMQYSSIMMSRQIYVSTWSVDPCSSPKMKVSYLFTSMLTCLKGGTVSRTMRSLCHLFKQYVVDGEVTTTVLLILNQLQLKNCSAGLKERPSPVYQVLTMTRQNLKRWYLTSVEGSSLGTWCYNCGSHWSPIQLPLPKPKSLCFLCPLTTQVKRGGSMLSFHKRVTCITWQPMLGI